MCSGGGGRGGGSKVPESFAAQLVVFPQASNLYHGFSFLKYQGRVLNEMVPKLSSSGNS